MKLEDKPNALCLSCVLMCVYVSCQSTCSVGKFGINCSESCSPNCMSSDQASVSLCDSITGTCLKGCQMGFSGALCRDGCKVEMYGVNCKYTCSRNCAPAKQINVSSCDTKTGTCTYGCRSSFSGAQCQKYTGDTDTDESSSFLVVILVGVGVLLIVVVVVVVCVKRQKSKQ